MFPSSLLFLGSGGEGRGGRTSVIPRWFDGRSRVLLRGSVTARCSLWHLLGVFRSRLIARRLAGRCVRVLKVSNVAGHTSDGGLPILINITARVSKFKSRCT